MFEVDNASEIVKHQFVGGKLLFYKPSGSLGIQCAGRPPPLFDIEFES